MSETSVISSIDQAINYSFCKAAQSTFHGLAEIIQDNGQGYPATICNGSAVKILPDALLPIRLFWMIDSATTYQESRQSYGAEVSQNVSMRLSLYAVGKRSALDEQCRGNVAEFAALLLQSLPRERFIVSTAIKNARLSTTAVDADSGSVSRSLYGRETDRLVTDIFACRISMTVDSVICEGVCGTAIKLCPDVTVTDTDSEVYEVAAGGSFACTPCAPPVAVSDVRTMRFVDDTGGYEIPRFQYDGTFDTASALNLNIATSTYYLNGAVVLGVVAFVAGDSLLVRFTKTAPFFPATITLAFVYTASVTAENANDYLWEIWENLQNATALPNEYNNTQNALFFDSAAIGYNKGANGKYRATGAFRIEFAANDIRLSGGISNQNPITYPATLWNRIKHCWVVIYPNATCRTLGAVEAGATTLTGVTSATEFAIEDTGSSVIYQYRQDPAGAWTTWYTSSLAYVPNTVWHSDICGYSRYIQFKGFKIYGQNIV